MKMFVTFGRYHKHVIDGKVIDSDCVAVIECKNHNDGLRILDDVFGLDFAFIYTKERNKKIEFLKYFPRGFFKIKGDNVENKKEECNVCEHRRSIPGDRHIRCNSPDPKMIGSQHAIKRGWFNYPFNFDPIWKLDHCNNFSYKEE